MGYNQLSIKDCMKSTFPVLSVMHQTRTLSSCYQAETAVAVGGVQHTMDISWQKTITTREGVCTSVLTTTQSLPEAVQITMAIC